MMNSNIRRAIGSVAAALILGGGGYGAYHYGQGNGGVGGVTVPTPVPSATTQGVLVGNGFIRNNERDIVRTSSAVYVFAVDDNICQGASSSAVIRAYKGTGGTVPTSFTEVDAAHHPVSAGVADCTTSGSSEMEEPDVRLDNAGIIEMSYADQSNGDVYYQTFDPTTDTWGSRVLIATNASTISGTTWPRTGQTALTLTSADKAVVVWATTGATNSMQYSTNSSGSWSAPASIVTGGSNIMHPSLVTSIDGTVQLAWLNNSLATHATVMWASYNGTSWSSAETVSSGDTAVLSNGDDDQGPSLATDPSSRPVIVYMDGTVNGADNFVRIRYRTGTNTWVDNSPPGGAGGSSTSSGTLYAHSPGVYVESTGAVYALLGHDVNIEFGYEYQVSGLGTAWGAYTTLDPQSKTNTASGDTCEPGTDGSASIRFDPPRDSSPNILDVVYFDERDDTDCAHHHARVFYKAVELP